MGTISVYAKNQGIVDLANIVADPQLIINVTKDSNQQICLENQCNVMLNGSASSHNLIKVELEGDAVVQPKGQVKWKVIASNEIVEIQIEPKIKDPGQIDIWDVQPQPDTNGRDWVGQVKDLQGVHEQYYYLHYLVKGSSKWRTIDPIIRVNK